MQNNVIGFLRDKALQYNPKGNDLFVRCFNKSDHWRGDLNPSLGIDSSTGVFYCWSCHVRGSFPQLIGAFGFEKDISKYSTYQSKRRVRFDIETLKAGGAMNIPGIGKFVEKPKDGKSYDRDYIESRKISLAEGSREISDRIISGEGTRDDRLDYMRKNDAEGVVDLAPPENLIYRATYIDYFSERGLPSNFCDYTEIYLPYKNAEWPEYKSRFNLKYFYVPVRGVFGNIRTFMGVSFSKETEPRMYHAGPKISNPILDLTKFDPSRDLYVVEGWLDHYKLQVLGYNSIPTLSNIFTVFHFTLLASMHPGTRVFFVYDQDVAGYQAMQNVVNYVSRSTDNWYAVFLPHYKFKDVGDIDLTDIPLELATAKKYPMYQIKKYMMMLGAEKYNGSKEILKSDRYSFRRDSVFQEFGVKHIGGRDENSPEPDSGLRQELPGDEEREDKPGNPGGLVPVQHSQV